MKNRKRTSRIVTASVSLILLIMIFTALPIRGESEIYESVIRLHVIANSDSDEDQSMKLFVRDRILSECASELVKEESSADLAVKSLSCDMSAFEECANTAISDYCRENGIADVPSAKCEIGREKYPYKEYERLCFPQGEYYSLRVTIGDGEGENWWCVLFPPLCVGAAQAPSDEEDAFVSVGITTDQYKIISESEKPKYRLRFRILEIIEGWFD